MSSIPSRIKVIGAMVAVMPGTSQQTPDVVHGDGGLEAIAQDVYFTPG